MQNSRITQTRSTFSLACGVEINIRAKANVVWALLTDAKGFSSWNSTVTAGPEGSTDFAMAERFSGLLLPLLKNQLPDFGPCSALSRRISNARRSERPPREKRNRQPDEEHVHEYAADDDG